MARPAPRQPAPGAVRPPVYIANDSQLAALAQYMFGGQQYAIASLVLKISHGVGAGIVLNGGLSGDGYGAGEIGHIRSWRGATNALRQFWVPPKRW